MSFNIALTGLNAATQDLAVTSNNLANADTIGFKSSRAEFGDIYAATATGVSSTAVGNGVTVQEVAQQFAQGNVETTGNSLDLAINGNGFFTVSNGGSLEYTRDGEFQINNQGQGGDRHRRGSPGVRSAAERRLQHRRLDQPHAQHQRERPPGAPRRRT